MMETDYTMNTDDKKQAAFGSEYTIITNKDYDEQHPLDLEANFEELTNYLPAAFDFSNKTAASANGHAAKASANESGAEAGDTGDTGDEKKAMDALYNEYIAMHSGEIGFFDSDDLFPRSYHWRLDDRYAPEKKEILQEAIKFHKKIEETQAYQDYAEKKKRSKKIQLSWDD